LLPLTAITVAFVPIGRLVKFIVIILRINIKLLNCMSVEINFQFQ
jgi:hypothetical protein